MNILNDVTPGKNDPIFESLLTVTVQVSYITDVQRACSSYGCPRAKEKSTGTEILKWRRYYPVQGNLYQIYLAGVKWNVFLWISSKKLCFSVRQRVELIVFFRSVVGLISVFVSLDKFTLYLSRVVFHFIILCVDYSYLDWIAEW